DVSPMKVGAVCLCRLTTKGEEVVWSRGDGCVSKGGRVRPMGDRVRAVVELRGINDGEVSGAVVGAGRPGYGERLAALQGNDSIQCPTAEETFGHAGMVE